MNSDGCQFAGCARCFKGAHKWQHRIATIASSVYLAGDVFCPAVIVDLKRGTLKDYEADEIAALLGAAANVSRGLAETENGRVTAAAQLLTTKGDDG